MSGFRWTDNKARELKHLVESGFNNQQIAQIMQTSIKSVSEAKYRLGIKKEDRVDWESEKVETLKILVYEGLSDRAISKILSSQFNEAIGESSVANARNRYGILKHCLKRDQNIKTYNTAITLKSDNYIVAADYHSPYHSEKCVNRLLQVAEKFQIKKHIIPGDLIDNDFIKKWPNSRIEDQTTLDGEAKKTQPVFNALDYFEQNILIKGNHEDRVNRATDGKIQARHLFEIIGKEVWEKKFIYSTYDKLFIGDKWVLVHPRSYSQISASVAVRLAEKFQRHVLNAHGHFFAMRYDRSGQYMGVDLGGMFDVNKIGYINLKTTTHPRWNNGFVVITQDNKIHFFHENTDWEYYGVK